MNKVVLISCVSTKRATKAQAQDLYISPLFKMNLAYAKLLAPDKIYILSAKYGLLDMEDVIEPYNETLNAMKVADIQIWSAKVLEQMKGEIAPDDEVVFLAGERYRRYLAPHFKHHAVPLRGLGIGRQLQFLKRKLHA